MIIDDHPLYRLGIRRVLEESGRYRVIAEAGNGYEAIREANNNDPDIIIIDVQLPGINGLKIAPILSKQHPRARIIILSTLLDDERLLDAIAGGASAFLLKHVDAEAVLNTLDAITAGDSPINELLMERPQLAWRVVYTSGDADSALNRNRVSLPLSVREVEVLDCVTQGLSNKQAAAALYITEQTVKNHMTSLLRKLHVDDRVQVLLYAVRKGWVEIAPGSRPIL